CYRHHHHCDTEHTERINDGKISKCSFSIQSSKHQRGYCKHAESDNCQPFCSVFIEQSACHRTHNSHYQSTREQHHAGFHCAETEHRLHEDGQYHCSADHRHEDNHSQ